MGLAPARRTGAYWAERGASEPTAAGSPAQKPRTARRGPRKLARRPAPHRWPGGRVPAPATTPRFSGHLCHPGSLPMPLKIEGWAYISNRLGVQSSCPLGQGLGGGGGRLGSSPSGDTKMFLPDPSPACLVQTPAPLHSLKRCRKYKSWKVVHRLAAVSGAVGTQGHSLTHDGRRSQRSPAARCREGGGIPRQGVADPGVPLLWLTKAGARDAPHVPLSRWASRRIVTLCG